MRRLREKKENAYYHVGSHFHQGIIKFIGRKEKVFIINTIKSAQKKFSFEVKNLCIMNTHFHLLIKPTKNSDLSEIMKYIKQVFTQWLNRIYSIKGTAWQDRFFSRIIADFMDLLRTFRYIANNPLKGREEISDISKYAFYQEWVPL